MKVVDLLKHRKRTHSRPGHRDDPHRLVLVIEGGGSRATYPSGMALALDELGLLPAFDAVYGVSAGAITGAWFVSGEASRGLPQWPRMTADICDIRRLATGRPAIDTRAVLDASERFSPGIIERMAAAEVPLHPIATCTRNGTSVDLRPFIGDGESFGLALRASATIPFLSGRPVELAGRHWVDGGLAENVPFRTAVAGGATHVVVLRCRLEQESARPPRWTEHAAVASYLIRHSRPALGAWLQRYETSVADDAALAGLAGEGAETGPRVLEIRAPRGAHPITRLERNEELLRRAIYVGRAAGYAALAEVAQVIDSTRDEPAAPRHRSRQPAS